jgi:hypothetical protein
MGENDTARLVVRAFDGTRQPMAAGVDLLITLRDGFQNQLVREDFPGPEVPFDVPFNNNLGDNYTVIAFRDKYDQAGFTPVKVTQALTQTVDMMLLPKNSVFKFRDQDWATLKQNDPDLAKLLGFDASGDPHAEGRYNERVDAEPQKLACLFNLTTAMRQINLPVGNPFQYLKGIFWDEMAQDRFFGYTDKALIDQVKLAADQGEFAPELGASFFHPGATLSYKQVQFGEANVQLTFHEDDRKTIDGVDCVRIEPDIDYFKDLGAHALLEVVPNAITGGLTDPKQVYVLRWIAGRRAGVPEFNPPYTIA